MKTGLFSDTSNPQDPTDYSGQSYDESPEFWRDYRTPQAHNTSNFTDMQRFSLLHSPEFQKRHPRRYKNGILENDLEYMARLEKILNRMRPRNLNKEELKLTQYNDNPNKGFFSAATSGENQLHSVNEEGERSIGPRSFVSLDIETDDWGRPISIIAQRYYYNTQEKQFQYTGSFQRYYETHLKDILSTHGIHSFTPEKLKTLRTQQNATYSKQYFTDPKEEQALRDFIGSAAIIGQNIVSFDLPTLFHNGPLSNSVIDTVIAARNVWSNLPNGLDDIFKRIFGKTMEEAGLSHHDANADTIATMLIFQEMIKWEGPTGDAIRYIMEHPGTHLGTLEEMIKDVEWITNENGEPQKILHDLSQVVKAGNTYADIYRDYDRGDLYMSAKKIRISSKEQQVIDQNDLRDPLKMSTEQLIGSAQEEYNATHKGGTVEGFIASDTVSELQQAFNQFSFWKKSALVREVAKAKSQDEAELLIGSTFNLEGSEAQYVRDWAAKLKGIRERDNMIEFERQKERRLDKLKGHHFVSEEDEKIIRATKTFDDLSDAIENVTEKSTKWEGVLNAIGNIKFYDINQYVRSAQSQWSGITSAAKGVVPSFVLNPASRLGDAFFNSVNAQLTGYNAIQRTWTSGIGDAIIGAGGAIGGVPGMAIGMGVKGLIAAGSQVYGNYKQARMEKAGYDIQNSLNVTGALFSWIATPFQLLYKATKLLTGSFGLLTNRIKNFMSNSIGLMSQMGNPLTEMTGVDYGTYQGLSMVDIASLFNKGTMNSTIEDYVKQAKALYTTGEVNTSRMIAASMLGVFNDVYDPNASQDTYMNMANKVLRSMQGQSDEQKANTMYWATRIDSSLPSLLRTAEALGVTDIRTLMDPTKSRNWMYWHPLDEGEASNFRWTQYEWGAATTQLSNSKMRIGDRMWNAFGRDIFNAFNELVDALANEDWDTALSSITVMWNKVKETVKSLWEGFNKDGGLSDGLEKGLSKIKEWGITAATGIIKIWDDVFTAIVKKLGGLIAYLSTLHLDVKWENGGVTFGLSSISDVVTPEDNTRLYDTQASQYSSRQVAKKDMASLIGLAGTLGLGEYASIGDIRKRLTEMSNIPALNANGDYVMGNGLSWKKVQAYLASKGIMYDNPNQMTPDEISRIIDTLYAGSAWGYGYAEQAALAKSGLGSHASQEFIYDTPAYRTSQELLASLDTILVDSVKSLTGKDTGKVDIVITMPDGRSATIQTNNGVVTNMTGVSALSGAGSGMKVDVRSQSNQHY